MFYNLVGLQLLISNLFLMILWHLVVFVFSVKINVNYFNPSKFMYRERKWEKSGKLYVKVFKIKKWKDFLPQYVGNDGFSKRHLKNPVNLSEDYIKQFITETCRAEWNHRMCCMFTVVSLFFNSFFNGIIYSIIPIIANFPFIIIQRYNRIRLTKLLKRYSNTKQDITYKIVNA